MQKFARYLFLILNLVLLQNVLAQPLAKPEKCPAASVLQAVGYQGFTMRRNEDMAFLRMPENKFGSETTWNYSIGIFDPRWDDKKILSTVDHILPLMQFDEGPLYSDELNIWFCYYDLTDGYVGLLWTEGSEHAMTTLLRQHAKK